MLSNTLAVESTKVVAVFKTILDSIVVEIESGEIYEVKENVRNDDESKEIILDILDKLKGDK